MHNGEVGYAKEGPGSPALLLSAEEETPARVTSSVENDPERSSSGLLASVCLWLTHGAVSMRLPINPSLTI